MKKLITLTLMVLCLGMFSIGCSKPAEPQKTEPTPVEEAAPAETDADAETK